VMYTVDDPTRRAIGFKLSEGMDIPQDGLAIPVRDAEVEAGGNHPGFILRLKGRVLTLTRRLIGLGMSHAILRAWPRPIGDRSRRPTDRGSRQSWASALSDGRECSGDPVLLLRPTCPTRHELVWPLRYRQTVGGNLRPPAQAPTGPRRTVCPSTSTRPSTRRSCVRRH
jgi:hypothetical protein